MVGRNDPCPCGSGKKYKRCHAESGAREKPRALGGRASAAVKSDEEIEGVRRAGRLAAQVLEEACKHVAPGITTNAIDRLVHQMTLDAGAYPSPLNYPHPPTDPRRPVIAPRGFPKSVCTSINDVVCHGIPDETVLREGDIVNVDVTCTLHGFHGDTSRTVEVGTVSDEARGVTATAREALERAIAVVREGALFHDIVGSSRVDLQACKLEYSIVSPK